MDFGSLLYEAQRNERSLQKEPVRCYKTTFAPPKKDEKSRTLSVNVKKFLQKKEEEERRKDEEAKKKKEELIALRSQDKKAQKRVQVMLKRTKSANKSVMEDAIDDVNTVVTMAGPAQPDEDDYGYVSQEASAFYNKLMDKYAHMPPEEPKFSQAKKTSVKDAKEMNAAKERVRMALNRAEEEEMMPHKRKRKSKGDKGQDNDDFIDDNDYKQGSCRDYVGAEPPPKKPKRPTAPPPLDFNSLLKIAETKQFEPIVIEKKVEEEERPLTKKQRLEYEKELEWKRRKSEKLTSKNSESSKPSTNRIPKISDPNRIPKLSETQNKIPKLSQSQNRIPKLSESQNRIQKISEVQHKTSSNDRIPYKTDRTSSSDRKFNQSKPVQFDRGREHDRIRSLDSEQRQRKYSSGSDDDGHQQRREYNRQRQERSDSDNDRRHSIQVNQGARHFDAQERKHAQNKINHDNRRQNNYEKNKNYDSNEEIHEHSRQQHRTPENSECEEDYIRSRENKTKQILGEKRNEKSTHARESDRSRMSKEEQRQFQQRRIQRKSDNERRETPDSDSRRYHSYEDNKPQYRKSDHERQRKEFDVRQNNIKSSQERRKQYDSEEDMSKNDKYSNQNRSKSFVGSKYDSEEEHTLSKYSREKCNNERQSHSLSQLKNSRQREPSSDWTKSDSKTSNSEPFRSRMSDFDDRKKNLSKPESRNPQKSVDTDYKDNRIKYNQNSDRSRISDTRQQNKDEKSKYKELEYAEKSNKYSEKKPLNMDRSKYNNRLDRSQSFNNSDRDGKTQLFEDREKLKSSKQEQTRFSSDSKKIVPNAEDILRKSSDVWSKPCNVTPPKLSGSPVNKFNGLSERQKEILRLKQGIRNVNNSKQSPGNPSSSSRPKDGNDSDYSEKKIIVGKPGTGKPNLMKAAAARTAELRMQKQNSTPEKKVATLDSSKSVAQNNLKSKSINEMKARQFPPNDLKPKQFPPNDLRPKQFPPKDVRPRQFPPPDVRKRPKLPVKRRIIQDSEDEYDSEMDDFIDDGPEDTEDVSKYISEIFGYDRSRYSNVDDDDDECMESSFAQQMKEDIRSTKIGIMEDLEDMRKEKEEKMRALKKKDTKCRR